MNKCCSKCKQEKPLSEFYAAKGGKLGRRGSCIVCDKQYHKQYEKAKRQKSNTKESLEKRCEYQNSWNKRNRDKINKYRSNIQYRLSQSVRTRISTCLKNNQTIKNKNTAELLGCSIQDLKKHLESQFTKGMTWDNYGEWHVDHIRPCVSFDLSDESQQSECFHYSNLQPLWAFDNVSKGGKYK